MRDAIWIDIALHGASIVEREKRLKAIDFEDDGVIEIKEL